MTPYTRCHRQVDARAGAQALHREALPVCVGQQRRFGAIRVQCVKDGRYEVRVAWSAHENRASKTPAMVESADGVKALVLNQKQKPEREDGFHSLGVFAFSACLKGAVTVTTQGADGTVHVDCVQVLPASMNLPDRACRGVNDIMEPVPQPPLPAPVSRGRAGPARLARPLPGALAGCAAPQRSDHGPGAQIFPRRRAGASARS